MLPLAEVTGGSMALLAGIGMMTCMLLMRAQRQFRKSAASSAKSGHAKTTKADSCDPTTSPRAMRQAQAGVEGWQVKMHETTRELTAQLDTKIAMLQVLLHDAQQQTARLEQALARAESALVEERRSPPAHQTSQAAGLSLAGPHVGARAARGSQRPFAEIFALADAGHSSRTIAQRVNTPVGEVDLILGLRRELQPPTAD